MSRRSEIIDALKTLSDECGVGNVRPDNYIINDDSVETWEAFKK